MAIRTPETAMSGDPDPETHRFPIPLDLIGFRRWAGVRRRPGPASVPALAVVFGARIWQWLTVLASGINLPRPPARLGRQAGRRLDHTPSAVLSEFASIGKTAVAGRSPPPAR